MYHKWSKHIDIKYHLIWEKVWVKNGIVHIIHVETDDMVADILTKSWLAEPFERHAGNITGMDNSNANCAERFLTAEVKYEYFSSDEGSGFMF